MVIADDYIYDVIGCLDWPLHGHVHEQVLLVFDSLFKVALAGILFAHLLNHG